MRNVYLIGDYIDKIAENVRVDDNSETGSEKAEMKRLLANAMNRTLTQRQRKCLTMYYFENKKMKDIGKELGLSSPTVSKHIKAAKKKLLMLKIFF